jgi:predicted dehydrogenase
MNVTRRTFTKQLLAAGSAYTVTQSSSVLARPASALEKLNIGVIGVGGRGAKNLREVSSQNIVALCDVDETRLNQAASEYPAAKKYFDFRKLLDQKDLDAVVVATPDHQHAPASCRALQRGLHVYCEKPLTHTVAEARILAQLAAEKKLATQMGTQNHEHPGYIRLVELIESGVIGQVEQVHVITDRPGSIWPQGLRMPVESKPIPADLKWDLWLGPARSRPYHDAYVPFRWRGWWDFGCGAIGDMAIHLMDPAFWALRLGGPVTVSSFGPPPLPHCGPTWMITRMDFEKRGDLVPCSLYWYEGEAQPPQGIAKSLPMNGSLFIGTKGNIATQQGGHPVLLPEEKFVDFKGPDPYLPKSPGHHNQWIEACKSGTQTSSHFGYAGPFTEIVLLGNVAYRIGGPVHYDPETMSITNNPKANNYLSKDYRKGWEVS